MPKGTTSGPESPLGRKRVSTRNTKPSAVSSESAAIVRRASLCIHSLVAMRPAPSTPSVSPSARKTKTRSRSEDTFSSLPPALPIPTASRSWGRPSPSSGRPCRASSVAAASRIAWPVATPAKAVIALQTSSRLAAPRTSRSIRPSISHCRARRRAVSIGKAAPASSAASRRSIAAASSGAPTRASRRSAAACSPSLAPSETSERLK